MSLKDLKPVRVNFNLRQLNDIDELTAVNCVVRWNNQRLVLTSVERVKPKDWNERDQKATSRMIGSSEFNHRLKNIKGNIENSFRSYLNDFNQYPSLEEFRVIAKKAVNIQATEVVSAYSKTVIKFIDLFISDCETGVKSFKGSPMSPNSIKRYRALKNNLTEFSANKKINALTFDMLSVSLIQDFKRFLVAEKEYTPGTIQTRLKGLTTILNWATKLKVNSNLDFKDAGLSEAVPQTFEIYLNPVELKKMEDLDLPQNSRLDCVRDLFFLGCWTALRFEDLFQVDHTKLEQDINGHENIRLTPLKTKEEVIIPVLPIVGRILAKYRLPDNTIKLPEISNQKLNEYSKELGKLAEINDPITYTKIKGGKKEIHPVLKYSLIKTHTMRRSFATNLYEMGEDVKAIMDITGHKRTEEFFNYIRRTPNNSANKIRKTVEEAFLRASMKAVS